MVLKDMAGTPDDRSGGYPVKPDSMRLRSLAGAFDRA